MMLDFVKSDAQFFCSASRQTGGGWAVSAQLSPEAYVALDGKKVRVGDRRVTFRRWMKGDMDRMYVTVWAGRNRVEPGYFDVRDISVMEPDASGHIGIICSMMDTCMYEETARAIAQAVGL